MKIRKLHLQNIGVFDDETIEFQHGPDGKGEVHILTGENGTGKTTLLMALASTFDDTGVERDIQRNIQFSMDADFQLSNSFRKRFRQRYRQATGFEVTFEKEIRTKLESKGNLIDYTTFPEIYSYSGFASGRKSLENKKFKFAVFAFSGYRRVESKRVEALFEPTDFNPLSQSLDFIKDYSQENQITINQLIANNLSKSAIEKDRNKEKSERFAKVLTSIEQIIAQITGWNIQFDMQTEPINLVIKVNNEELDFDVLPDGLRSLISWIADLLGRVDLLKWEDDLPITDKNLILFLDEIEVHLHPAWQRKVLPVVQKLFKNSQIFISTHSPFVVNSIDDAWVYKLELKDGKAKVAEVVRSEDGVSYQTVLSEIFGIDQEFGGTTQEDLDRFYSIVRNGKEINEKELLKLAKSLAVQSDELNSIVQIELRQLGRRKGKKLSL